ncbi:4-(cytidine 5'-diphospho)-2-C-methyl-D-erythritol kinase [Phaeobacter porticola]|uniref:4-diphosphocytidyl-2-C-methyl-D-erythritol kinase n=1 Tax=Phaeobacter porticola TaxID=1844006 RepID=A0A1L3I8E5_9RHOB|nr:4-(cytidine 5'-diphospho)-2-C-methyl-D-erythritol kinase [Phaeobacter porticola]APG48400.1 putative 4-diphosphocytidyl-2-C-methyl-D-erythritol kinase [Phaeobacter porticola]
MTVEGFAPAKINLTLHVTGRRADGYHLLDSLVVFADIGDRIFAERSDQLSLSVVGPMAAGVPTGVGNLMMQAAEMLSPGRGAALVLEKHLPPASGIGGGSSDAAATLRLLSELWKIPVLEAAETLVLGADLPVCMRPSPQRMQGIGEQIVPVASIPDCAIMLVNPGVSVATPAIFRALGRRDNPPMPDVLPTWGAARDLADWLRTQRNDLEAPAISIQPVIEDVLQALASTEAIFSAMSGSGATCYALFESKEVAQKEAARLTEARPDWWVQSGMLLR